MMLLSLSAGLRVDDRQFCVFQVKVTLSAEGEARWREVVGVVEEHLVYVPEPRRLLLDPGHVRCARARLEHDPRVLLVEAL